MSSENFFSQPINCKIVDSFVRYTKLKSTKGSGEAWLYIGREADNQKYDEYFSDFRKTNKYFFEKNNLISYIDNAEFEYKRQKRGYRNNIIEKYNFFKDKIYALENYIYFKNLKRRIDGKRYYISPKDKNNKLDNEHIWNFIRDIALPQISEIKISRELMPENYNYKFELEFYPIDQNYFDHNSSLLNKANIDELKKKYEFGSLQYKKLIDARKGQGYFRDQVLKRMNYCIITGSKEILDAAHIKPWTKSDDEEKIDSFNGIMLTPNCHKLFDKGLICFNKKGEVKVSYKLDQKEFNKLINVEKKINLKPILDDKTQKYIKWHADYFKDNFK
jgi:putative restriction endonuclease